MLGFCYTGHMKTLLKTVFAVAGVLLSLQVVAQPFTADVSVLSSELTLHQERYEAFPRPPYLTVYQKGNKKLVLLAARHGEESLPAVQYAFDEYKPQAAFVEREPNEAFGPCLSAEDGYTAALASLQQIPLVRMDVSLEQQWLFAQGKGFSYEDWQMLWIIREGYGRAREIAQPLTAKEAIATYAKRDHHPEWGTLFTEQKLNKYFKKHYKQNFEETDFIKLYQDLMNIYPEKWVIKTPFYRLNHATGLARSQFMLQNIAAALNKYDVVFAEMGAGHYLDLVEALQQMLGAPQVIDGKDLPEQMLWKECNWDKLKEIVLVK